MNNEKQILQTWLTLKENGGLLKAKKAKNTLLFFGLLLSFLVAYMLFHKLNPIYSILPLVLIGWSIAERNALCSRIESWPKLEKYLNWELIRQNHEK